MMRLAAALGTGLDVIEPCGFPLDDRRMRRAGMDYIDMLDWARWPSWQAYRDAHRSAGAGRLVLLTTAGSTPYCDFTFAPDDRLLVGQESVGVPEAVHDTADARLVIPMAAGARSLNVALAAAMVLGEALRQIGAERAGG